MTTFILLTEKGSEAPHLVNIACIREIIADGSPDDDEDGEYCAVVFSDDQDTGAFTARDSLADIIEDLKQAKVSVI
jgi:hypothetical protein